MRVFKARLGEIFLSFLEDLSQASFKYTHFAVAGKSSYEDERRSLCHHHMMISDAEGLKKVVECSIMEKGSPKVILIALMSLCEGKRLISGCMVEPRK